jgi:hypothetical protein
MSEATAAGKNAGSTKGAVLTEVLARFKSGAEPEGPELKAAIEAALAA